MHGDLWGPAQTIGFELLEKASAVDWLALVENKWARAFGMLLIVWATIWIIALVYSGYARDSKLGPLGVRPHTNKRLGEDAIVFDQSIFPFQMDGVEATCTFSYQYEDRTGKTQIVQLRPPEVLKLHIRASPIPKDSRTHFGFEGPDEVASNLVTFPKFDVSEAPAEIGRTPETVGSYISERGLVLKWTDDDDARIVSVGETRWELLTEARKEFIRERAAQLDKSLNGNWLEKSLPKKDPVNVFGGYHLRIQFSKHPAFVLFKHPNPDLKMTAWLTLLTSVFALVMDLWPVDRPPRETVTSEPARAEQNGRAATGRAQVPARPAAH